MQVTCPNCERGIEAEDININTNLAKCRFCNSLYKASDLVGSYTTERDSEVTPNRETNLSQPPAGSRLQLESIGEAEWKLFYPAKGFQGMDVFLAGFAVAWLSFVAFWTWGASHASIFFALFSIPFWLVGIGMVVGLLNRVNETQTLILTPAELSLNKSRILGAKSYSYALRDIHNIKVHPYKAGMLEQFNNLQVSSTNSNTSQKQASYPAILSGDRTIYLFEKANDAEQEWIQLFLQDYWKKYRDHA